MDYFSNQSYEVVNTVNAKQNDDSPLQQPAAVDCHRRKNVYDEGVEHEPADPPHRSVLPPDKPIVLSHVIVLTQSMIPSLFFAF
jgi:hypothetical protein